MAIKSFLTASILMLASLASALPAPPAADCSAAPPAPPAPSGAPAPGVPKPAAAAKISCPVVFSGQIPKAAKLTDFDSAATSLFNPNNVKGNDTWSQILLFPTSADSARFDDAALQKPLEVTLNDRSIFKTQFGFRRAGLLFKNDTNTQGAGNTGVKTLHWSVKQDPARPLNLTHEYLNIWHEAGDFSGNQFNFEAGTLIGQEKVGPADTFKFLNRKNELIFQTPIDKTGKWQGFAVTLDFNKNTLQIFYSPDPATPLKAVLPAPVANDNSGFGQFQMGMLKKPTGDTSDVVNKGTQEAGINEGQIYGGIFLEDSANGCISL